MTNRERYLLAIGIEYGEGHRLSPNAICYLLQRYGLASGREVSIRGWLVIVKGKRVGIVRQIETAARNHIPF